MVQYRSVKSVISVSWIVRFLLSEGPTHCIGIFQRIQIRPVPKGEDYDLYMSKAITCTNLPRYLRSYHVTLLFPIVGPAMAIA